MTDHVLKGGVGAFAVVGTSITLKTRSNLAIPHLCSAARFSRQVSVIEKANKGNPFGVFWDDMRDFATASVVMSAASLECYANELYSDRDELFSDHDKTVLGKFWEFFERKSPFEKLDFALTLRGKADLDKTSSSYQSASKLIMLRNALVHFKPEWSNELNHHKKISERLAGEFVPANITNDEFIFPRGWVGHSCTSWAVNAVLNLIADFEARADLGGRTEPDAWQGKLIP